MTDTEKAQIVILEVCRYMKLDESRLTSTPNVYKYAEGRYYIFYFCHCKTKLTAMEIALRYNMSRSSVYTAKKMIKNLMIFAPERKKTEQMDKLIEARFAEVDKIKCIERQAIAMGQL